MQTTCLKLLVQLIDKWELYETSIKKCTLSTYLKTVCLEYPDLEEASRQGSREYVELEEL